MQPDVLVRRPALCPRWDRDDAWRGGYDEKREGRAAVKTKQQMLKAIEDLPEDAGVEEVLDRPCLLYKVERGLRQADRGEIFRSSAKKKSASEWRNGSSKVDGASGR